MFTRPMRSESDSTHVRTTAVKAQVWILQWSIGCLMLIVVALLAERWRGDTHKHSDTSLWVLGGFSSTLVEFAPQQQEWTNTWTESTGETAAGKCTKLNIINNRVDWWCRSEQLFFVFETFLASLNEKQDFISFPPPPSSFLHPLVSALISTWSRMMIGAATPQRTINCACDRCSSRNQ